TFRLTHSARRIKRPPQNHNRLIRLNHLLDGVSNEVQAAPKATRRRLATTRSAVRPSHRSSGFGRGGGLSSTSFTAASICPTPMSWLVPSVIVIGRSVLGRSVRQGMPR